MTKKSLSKKRAKLSNRERELHEEREYLNGIAESLEGFLQVCYEEIGDYDLCFKFTKFPKIISMIRDQEFLRCVASKIYVYATILHHRDHEITFDPQKETFKVRVINYDYPF